MKTKTYSFECEKACRSHRNEGRQLWTLTVRAGDLPTGFKFGPNARYASLKARPVKEMLTTLRDNPDSFIFKNNSMMVVAESIKVEGTSVTITCEEPTEDDDLAGHGVLNGGTLTRRFSTHSPRPRMSAIGARGSTRWSA